MKKVLLFCGSKIADYDDVINYLKYYNKFTLEEIDTGGARLNPETILEIVEKIQASPCSLIIVKRIRDKMGVATIKRICHNVGVVYFNHRYSYLINKQISNNYPSISDEYRLSSGDSFFQELLFLSLCGDYYLNEDSINNEMERFIDWIIGGISLNNVEKSMRKAIENNQNDIGKTSCVITDDFFNELSTATNHPLISDENNRVIKTHIINYLLAQFDVSSIDEKLLNRVIDPSFNTHAETEAIFCVDKKKRKFAFVTKKPCYSCLKHLYRSNTKDIFYLYDYYDPITESLIEIKDLNISLFSGCINSNW